MKTDAGALEEYLKRPGADSLIGLLREHQDVAYTICLNVLEHPQDAEDAAQEALLEVASGLGQLREPRAFRSWLYRLVYRTAVDHLRKRRAYVQAKERGQAMAETLLPEEDRSALHEAIARLPDDERLLLVDHYFEKVNLVDLARREGVSSVAVWKRLERVRGRLKRVLAGAGFGLAAASVANALESVKPAAAPAGLIGKSIAAKLTLAAAGGIAVGTKTAVSGIAVVVAGLCLFFGAAGGYWVGAKRAVEREGATGGAAETLRRDLESARADLQREKKRAAAAETAMARVQEGPRREALAAEGTPAAREANERAKRDAGFEAKVRAVDWKKHVHALVELWRVMEKARAEGRTPVIGTELRVSLAEITNAAGELARELGYPPEEATKVYENKLVERAWRDAILEELAGSPLSEAQLAALRKTAIYAENVSDEPSREGRLVEAWISGLEHNLNLVRETRGVLTPEQYAAVERAVTPTFMLSVYDGYTEKLLKSDAASVGQYWLDAWKLPETCRATVESVAADYLAGWTALQQSFASRYGAALPRDAEIERKLRELELQKKAEDRLAQSLPVDEELRRKILRGSSSALCFEPR